ncbi:KH domain-containing protein At4g18375-like [Phragmites australis]|uniref:KH domain-containing protein At4g18375-like n=1 Tax=Phragmites australis TaxID=29695 RepID=UPI002D775F30|nr:KH domain-containing protein At4g18375-like [Phragmites australis]XP_062191554.1 KH domain-containing protein At4g18375-like [Phragmites australis]XP_062191555.1 KH domain-containing protein At4g18375-like [Phragmites australis]
MRQQTGKRTRQHRDYDREERNDQKKRPFPHAQESFNNDELVVYRILCPDSVIGSVIGKNGNVINAIRQQTNAKVKVVDPYPGSDKRVILVYCYIKHRDLDVDEGDNGEPVCAAQDALFRVQNAIADALDTLNKTRRDSDKKNTEEANILVPASQAASIIGKSGAVIKYLRSTSRAFIKVSPKDPSDTTHSCAMSFDNFVQITGGAEAVRKALFGISTIIYKYPSKENIPLETSVPELTSSIIVPSELPVYPASNFYSAPDAAIPSGHPSLSILGSSPHVPELTLPADAHGRLPIYQSVLPSIPTYSTPRCSGDLVFRVLCPGDKIGLVIGRGGGTIKSIRQESGARIDVDDAKNDREESIITITSTESTDDVKSAAVEAVLLLQAKINDYDEDRMNLRLLVPTKVIGCLIGKGGSIVNDMRKKTKAGIRISKGDKPRRASSSDELVEVFGEADKLRDALVHIVLRLREDVLKDRMDSQNSDRDGKLNVATTDSFYGSLSLPALLPCSQQVTPLGYDRRDETERGLEVFPRSSSYGYSSLQVADDGYGGLSSYTSKAYEGRLPRVEMTIPASGLSKVMGKRGTNLDNIRKISGAHIEIIESKSSRHDHVAHISGTSEQRQSAENLIKAFIMST